MAASFGLRIVACDKVFYDGRATVLVFPAPDGERAVMAHHENMVIVSRVGELSFETADGERVVAVAGDGVVQIANNRVTVLVDTAERPEDIDERRAAEALERAEEQLRQKQSIVEYHMSQASVARALSRLKEKQKYQV